MVNEMVAKMKNIRRVTGHEEAELARRHTVGDPMCSSMSSLVSEHADSEVTSPSAHPIYPLQIEYLLMQSMRQGAQSPKESQRLRNSMLKRMDSVREFYSPGRVSEIWHNGCKDGPTDTTGTPSSVGLSSWKSLEDVPDWRPSLVGQWRASVMSVWRHSLTESVVSQSARASVFSDANALTLERAMARFEAVNASGKPRKSALKSAHSNLGAPDCTSKAPEDRGEMTRAQKRTRNRAMRRNRHRQRQQQATEAALQEAEVEVHGSSIARVSSKSILKVQSSCDASSRKSCPSSPRKTCLSGSRKSCLSGGRKSVRFGFEEEC